MRRRATPVLFVLSFLIGGSAVLGQGLGWPRTVQQPSGKLVLFEPHVDSWDSGIVWRQAFQLTPAGRPITLGAASFEAEVLYATSAATVILFDGPPVFAPITGTQLERATNTPSPVFRLKPAGTYYYLVVGRWFSAPSLKGPWSEATSSLPTDFSNIPPDSPAGAVLAAVLGTTQAEDAALLSQVPKRPALSARQVSVTSSPVYTVTYASCGYGGYVGYGGYWGYWGYWGYDGCEEYEEFSTN